MTIRFSRNLAVFLGILIPLLETVRRWNTWRENLTGFFDDYLLSAFLLFGAWQVAKDAENGQKFLAAAWGFVCGLGYYSFFGQLNDLMAGKTDPAPISSEIVLVIKGIGIILAILGLIGSLRKPLEKG